MITCVVRAHQLNEQYHIGEKVERVSDSVSEAVKKVKEGRERKRKEEEGEEEMEQRAARKTTAKMYTDTRTHTPDNGTTNRCEGFCKTEIPGLNVSSKSRRHQTGK